MRLLVLVSIQITSAIRQPNTKKPPGGVMNTVMGSTLAGMICTPNSVPAPSSSRMEPITSSVRVKPRPMPRPSSAESRMPCLDANISARPRMMQFTTISGRKMPSAESREGRYALTSICSTVTKVAITVM